MGANTILTSVVTGGSNNHTTVAEEANSMATDFVTQGVVGAVTLNAGSGGTGSFCVNADASPDMGVTIKAGQAYITVTPSSQGSQILRARASADYTAYTINANSSGSTKYDWIYLSVSATNANNPDAAADNVTSVFTSRSSSNTTDNGSPPTYGLLLAIVTVINAASSITNSNITDKRFNTSIGAQNGSLIVTQQSTGTDATVQAAGGDANISITLAPKGTGATKLMTTLYNPYKFSVYRNSAQNSGNGAFAKINFDTKRFDTSSNFDAATNFRFTAPISGFYYFSATVSTAASVTNFIVALYKNGSELVRGTKGTATQSGGEGATVAALLQLTASDYIETFCFANTTVALEVGATAPNPVFFGFLMSAT